MARSDPPLGFFDDALALLQEADRMHRQFFNVALGRTGACWEPPVDIVESGRALIIRVALPGVPAAAVEVKTDGQRLHVRGVRTLSAGAADTIHRLEIPHGCFERTIELPAGRYELVERRLADGCLVLALRRLD